MTPPPDSNNPYPWQSEPELTDKLDFRHHNYNEMRKVKHFLKFLKFLLF